jgi:hypothetical protein
MNSQDIGYYHARAAQEREAARRAAGPHIAEIHFELAKAYEALIENPELRSALRIVAAP